MRLSSATLDVLAALLESAPEPRYGMELMQLADVKSGTLYPILERLEQEGWAVGEWEQRTPQEAARPRRRYYRLTAEGEIVASREIQRAASRFARASRRLLLKPAPRFASGLTDVEAPL